MLRRPVTHQLSLISFTTGCGALLLLPFSVWEYSTGFTLKFDLLSMATLAYVVIFPSTLAYLFFNRGMALIGPNRAAPFFHLVPVFGSAMAIVLLGEQLQAVSSDRLCAGAGRRRDRLAQGLGEVMRIRDRGTRSGFRFHRGQASLPANPSTSISEETTI